MSGASSLTTLIQPPHSKGTGRGGVRAYAYIGIGDQDTPTEPADLENKAPTPTVEEVIPIQTSSATIVRVDEEDTMPYPYLWEPLRMALVVLDFRTSTINLVIDRVLNMDRAQNNNIMLMGTFQRALPKEEEL